ncbi:MAG: LLM class flavin-dependent oxidoreductase [Gammaproteobacteria bacterium]|nr:LLM class flavin-dependent oxidoreductase [Gammaproteobacteria bacterium]
MRLHVGTTPWVLEGGLSIARQAKIAESLGFESFWLPENHLTQPFSLPDPLMMLAAAAALTTRIQLATTSYLLPLRAPLAAAEQIAALDNLSDGRLLLGLGRGFDPDTLAAFGVEQSKKRAMFSAHLDTILSLLKGEPVPGCEGDRRLSPTPVQRPYPSMVVAAFGPKAIEQAGSLGLPYLASPAESSISLEDKYREHRAACAAHGHTPPSMVPVMRTVFISEDTLMLQRARELIAKERRLRRIEQEPNATIDEIACVGTGDEVRARIETLQDRLGMTHFIASRIRLQGMDEASMRVSMEALSELVGEVS